MEETLVNTSYENEFEKIVKLSYTWTVKRTAWQPVLSNILYGFVIAIAELTDRIIYSGDRVWNIEIFPVKAEEFLPISFRWNY